MRMLMIALTLVPTIGCANHGAQERALENQLKAQDERINLLDAAVKDIRNQESLREFIANSDHIAYLTPGSDGYSTVVMDLGSLTVSLENVEPYANGSRVSLKFGNLMSAGINGVKATIEWGSVDQKGRPKNDEQHSKEVSFTATLRAGSWTTVPAVLEAVQPAALGFVRLRNVTHTGISLSK